MDAQRVQLVGMEADHGDGWQDSTRNAPSGAGEMAQKGTVPVSSTLTLLTSEGGQNSRPTSQHDYSCIASGPLARRQIPPETVSPHTSQSKRAPSTWSSSPRRGDQLESQGINADRVLERQNSHPIPLIHGTSLAICGPLSGEARTMRGTHAKGNPTGDTRRASPSPCTYQHPPARTVTCCRYPSAWLERLR